jgi:hypothetical protein
MNVGEGEGSGNCVYPQMNADVEVRGGETLDCGSGKAI